MLWQVIKLKKSDYVLDVACGSGRLLKMLKQKSSFYGYGLDISETMIETAKKTNPEMEFVGGSCNNLPFADNTFNIITTCASFHHFYRPENFVVEAYRVLQEEGIIYLADVYYPHWLSIILNLFIRFSTAGDDRFYAPKEIIKIFSSHGFEPLNTIVSDYR